jgi:hypothetical protein
MKISILYLGALSICFTATVLPGCGGSQTPIGAPGAMPRTSALATHAERGKSWMLPEARRDKLLYVSDNTNGLVYVLSYTQGALVGTLSGFDSPVGLCADRGGNIWIVNQTPDKVIQYGHGDTAPKRTLKVPGYFSFGCAVDPKNRDLAVTVGAFSVAIFRHGRGHATTYNDDDLDGIWYCGFDDRDDLFCGGENGYGAPLLAELPAGGRELKTLSFNFTMHHQLPGAVQWDGRRLAVAEQGENDSNEMPVFRVKIVGSTTHLTRTTELDGSSFCCGFQGWLHRHTYISVDNSARSVAFWSYPQGGEPVTVIPISGAGLLWGCALSL